MGIEPFPNLSGGKVSYVDDVVIWISGPLVEKMKPLLESKASLVVTYKEANCLILNPEKTQVLWLGSGMKSPSVLVGNTLVPPKSSIDILGMKFDRSLSSDPHIRELISASASLADS